MEIRIKEEVEPEFKNEFVIRFKVEHGDADHSDEFEVSIPYDKLPQVIENLIEFDKEKSKNYQYRREANFNEIIMEEDFFWPNDVRAIGDYYPAALDEWKVFYYSAFGVKHKVEVIL